eukprot:10119003-Alexandrium_andersonii.AAC.1
MRGLVVWDVKKVSCRALLQERAPTHARARGRPRRPGRRQVPRVHRRVRRWQRRGLQQQGRVEEQAASDASAPALRAQWPRRG